MTSHATTPAAVPQPAAARLEARVRTSCRSCGSRSLEEVLDFGNLYISNFADVPDATRWPRVPLELLLCSGCGLLQLRHTPPAEWLYRQYWYKSGVSASMRAALADITQKASEFVALAAGDHVLDIGANDGTLLRSYHIEGIRRVGFEPAENLIGEASQGTDRIIPEFFSAGPIVGERFRVVTSIAMFYDLEAPNDFVADVASVLARDGVWVVEMHYLPLIIARNAFDAVCHEHLEYYSLASLERLLAAHGLAVANAETNDVNGGSFRVYVVHSENYSARTAKRRARVDELRLSESSADLDRPRTYEQFGKRIHSIGERLRRCLEGERAAYRDVSVYGASTKGNTLLQVFGIGQPLIRSAAERNPVKWGKYTVGSWIPIVSEEEARSHSDDFLILPWHFLPEIRARESDFVARGGKLIVPLPEPRFIDERGVHPIA